MRANDEIEQIAGAVNVFTVDGTVTAIGGAVTVRPDMVMRIQTRLRVTVEVGGSDEEEN